MPLPLIAIAATAALPALAKIGLGAYQLGKKVEETTYVPPALRENIALDRQAAASARLPGVGAAEDQLAQNTAAILEGGRRAGASAPTLMGALAENETRRQKSLVDLSVRGATAQIGANERLKSSLNQLSSIELSNRRETNAARAAMKQAGLTNINNGLTEAATSAMYLGTRGGADAAATDADFWTKRRKGKSMWDGIGVSSGAAQTA